MITAPPHWTYGEKWEDVLDYSLTKVLCHICLGDTAVKQGRISVSPNEEVHFPGIEKKHLVNRLLNCKKWPSWTYWQLCQSCYDQGWRPPEEALWGHILYTNSVTKENRAV